MAEVFEIRAIKPERMKTENFERAVERGLDSGAKIIQKSFKETVSTFSARGKSGRFKARPKFQIQKKRSSRLIFTDSEIYSFLNFGTKIRWALMSSDWRSKTSPGRLTPGSGSGRAVIMGKRAMLRRGIPPRPGIKARKFDKAIVKRDARDIQRVIEQAVAEAARNLF